MNFEKRTYRLIGVTPLLASQPANPDVRTAWLAKNAPTPEKGAEETKMLPAGTEKDDTGLSVFLRDTKHKGACCLMANHINGFLKGALHALSDELGILNERGKVDEFLVPMPAYIPITRNGGESYVLTPDQILERPLRADTMQGPRTSLKASEIIYAWQVEFTLALIPNKERGKSKKLTWDAVETALGYGQFKGLGEWRNSNMYGQFEWMRVDA